MKKTLRYFTGQTLVRKQPKFEKDKTFPFFPMILTFGSFYCKLSQTHFTYWKSSDTSALLSFDAISNGFHLHLCKEKFKTWPTIIVCRQTLKMPLLSCQQSAVTELFALAPMCLPQHQLQHQQSTSTKKLYGHFYQPESKKSSLQNMS